MSERVERKKNFLWIESDFQWETNETQPLQWRGFAQSLQNASEWVLDFFCFVFFLPEEEWWILQTQFLPLTLAVNLLPLVSLCQDFRLPQVTFWISLYNLKLCVHDLTRKMVSFQLCEYFLKTCFKLNPCGGYTACFHSPAQSASEKHSCDVSATAFSGTSPAETDRGKYM